MPEIGPKYLFVNASEQSTGYAPHKGPLVDRRAINAHIQLTAYRQRRLAAVEKHNRQSHTGKSKHPLRIQNSRKVLNSQHSFDSHSSPSSSGKDDAHHGHARFQKPALVNKPKLVFCSHCGSSKSARKHFALAAHSPNTETGYDTAVSSSWGSVDSVSNPTTGSFTGSPTSVLSPEIVDPFACSSVPLTRNMGGILRYCKCGPQMLLSHSRSQSCLLRFPTRR